VSSSLGVNCAPFRARIGEGLFLVPPAVDVDLGIDRQDEIRVQPERQNSAGPGGTVLGAWAPSLRSATRSVMCAPAEPRDTLLQVPELAVMHDQNDKFLLPR
jgi:hypothetical protein